MTPIALLQDNFTSTTRSPVWALSSVTGSATLAQTGGQAILTLPSSAAGAHSAAYATSGVYDFTGDGFYWDIATMVNTGVIVSAYFQLLFDLSGANQLYWQQLSNSITVHTVVAGVNTTLFTATWSTTTYKYIRIRESAGTVYFDSSTNGTAWTNRASVANPFAMTGLYVQFSVQCGNVVSPGSLRLDDVNLILPAPSSTWRETTADWSITNRLKPVTLAATANAQGALVTADTMDSSRTLGGTLHYFGGPVGSTSGGYLALTEYASLALAQASPFQIPLDGRVDLPALVDARYMRLYHRSTDASAHTLREFVPRRIVQAEDIEAESIRAINIAAGAVTADKIYVLNLAALSAQMGTLHMDGVIDIAAAGGIYQGTGTFAAPGTGLKLYNSSGVGKLSSYNATVEQVTIDTDGKLKWGAGAGEMNASGIGILSSTIFTTIRAYTFRDTNTVLGGLYGQGNLNAPVWLKLEADASGNATNGAGQVTIQSLAATGQTSTAQLQAVRGATVYTFEINIGLNNNFSFAGAPVKIDNGLNMGTATGATAGQISTSGSIGVGEPVNSQTRLHVKGQDSTSSNYGMVIHNSSATTEFYVRNDGVGFTNQASWLYSSDARLKNKVEKSDRGLFHIKQIEAKKFDYVNGAKDQLGFLAADVQKVMPELVVPIDIADTSAEPLLGILSNNLIPVLWSAVQELATRVEALEKK